MSAYIPVLIWLSFVCVKPGIYQCNSFVIVVILGLNLLTKSGPLVLIVVCMFGWLLFQFELSVKIESILLSCLYHFNMVLELMLSI